MTHRGHRKLKTWTILCGLAAATGCGGSGPQVGDAVVVPDPTTKLTSVAPGAPSGTPAPAAGTAAAAPKASATPAPAAAVKGDGGWGTLKGKVVFGGTPGEVKILVEQGKAAKDTTFCAKDAPIKSERLVVDAASKGVKNVIVYLPKPTAVNEEAKSSALQKPVEFDQKGCTFTPHVICVMLGAKINLKNSDPVGHNIDSKLKNNALNSQLAPAGVMPFATAGAERTPGVVVCDIHNWMTSYWMVLDNPYFAVTNDKGEFEIKNVPSGTQKVVVWQEATGFVTASSGQDVAIKSNEVTSTDFTLDPGKVRPE